MELGPIGIPIPLGSWELPNGIIFSKPLNVWGFGMVEIDIVIDKAAQDRINIGVETRNGEEDWKPARNPIETAARPSPGADGGRESLRLTFVPVEDIERWARLRIECTQGAPRSIELIALPHHKKRREASR